MTIDPLVAGALLILFVTFWFVAGVVDGTRPEPVKVPRQSPASTEPSRPSPDRELTHR